MTLALFIAGWLTLLVAPVLGHGGVIGYAIGNKRYTTSKVGSGQQRLVATPAGGQNLQRPWTSLSPVRSASSAGMACNSPGTPVRFSADVQAGSSVTAFWNPWPHNGGPLSVWMVECPEDCASFHNPHHARWFKIHDDGLAGAQKLVKNGNSLTVRIPASLKAGNYLMRHEIINLARPPAEFYVECAQLKVTGKGNASPPSNVRSTLSAAYNPSLPELSQSYETWKTKAARYKFPGPAPWRG